MARSFPGTATAGDPSDGSVDDPVIDLQRRRNQLNTRLAELQWDLGGLAYEMAIRDRFRVDVIIAKAAELQVVDAELSEIERILQLEKTHVAGVCPHCSSPHSSGASFCWQCGGQIMHEIDASSIFTSNAAE